MRIMCVCSVHLAWWWMMMVLWISCICMCIYCLFVTIDFRSGWPRAHWPSDAYIYIYNMYAGAEAKSTETSHTITYDNVVACVCTHIQSADAIDDHQGSASHKQQK